MIVVYFMKTVKYAYIYLLLYVEEMLLACIDMNEIVKLKLALRSEFDMKDLGSA